MWAAEQRDSPFSQFVPGKDFQTHRNSKKQQKKLFADWLNFSDDQQHNSWLHWINMTGSEGERRLYIISVFQERHQDYERGQAVNLEENNAVSCSWHVKTKKKPPPQPFFFTPTIHWSSSCQACLSTECIIIHFSKMLLYLKLEFTKRAHVRLFWKKTIGDNEFAGFWKKKLH